MAPQARAPFVLAALLALAPSASRAAAAEPAGDACAGASKRIQAIRDADQADREHWDDDAPDRMQEIARRDAERRKAVAELADRGCLKSADDYANAALVYQHGDEPEDYLRTYRWSLKATELGRPTLGLAAAGADRYLMNKGYKQLYASQANGAPPKWCYCLWPVEATASDDDRRKMQRPTLAQQLAWVDQINAGKSCPKAAQCQTSAKPAPKGSFPELGW